MPETLKQTQLFRFDQMAVQVKDKIDNPAEADVDRYVGLEHIDPESLKIRRWGETTDVESSKIIFKSGDIIFGKRRAYQRKLAVADFDGICSAHAMVLRPKTHVVLEEFLPFFMQSDIFMDRAVKISVGGLSPTINWSDIAKEEFALPPLEEQRRIAGVLQAASNLGNHLFSCIDAVDRMISALSFSTFSCLHNDERVPKRSLGELLSVDISNGIFRKRKQFGSGTCLINVTDVYIDFEVPTSDLERVPADQGEYESFSARPGDVIFNRSSLVLNGIGHACLVPDTEEKLVFECHLMRARPNPNEIDSRFLAHYALSPHGRQHLLSRAQTTTMTTIGQGDIREMVIPCPDLTTQRQIASHLDQLYSAKRELTDRQRHLFDFARMNAETALAASD